MKNNNFITGNFFDKYNTNNFLYKILMQNFLKNLMQNINDEDVTKKLNILDIGCGEGEIAKIICTSRLINEYVGIDLDKNILDKAKVNCPVGDFYLENILELNNRKYFLSRKYDYVLALEVLEHLDKPEKALIELQKLNADTFIFSVPSEPIWRILNLFRFKYMKDWGNTPGHVQHWSKQEFYNLLVRYFYIVDIQYIFPWTMVVCNKK